MVGEVWEPGTGEKGLRGLVRLTELRGLAGLLVLKEPDAPLATEDKPKELNKDWTKPKAFRILENAPEVEQIIT